MSWTVPIVALESLSNVWVTADCELQQRVTVLDLYEVKGASLLGHGYV